MQPLQITAYLGTPVGGNDHLPLDSILLYAALLERGQFDYGMQPGETRDYDSRLVPLQVRGAGDDWYYACSFAQWPEQSVKSTDYWNKRYDSQYADVFGQSAAAKVNPATGVYKNRHQVLQLRHALNLTWYAYGDLDAVTALLTPIMHIGKKRDIGFGYVLRWQVETISADYSCFDPHNNPMRSIPTEGTMGKRSWPVSHMGIRPPYYGLNALRECYVPRNLIG